MFNIQFKIEFKFIFAFNGQLVQLNRTEDYGSSDGGLSPPLPSKNLYWIS
jgi:hypothetical protein